MTPLVRPVLESLRNAVLHLRRFPSADVASQMLITELDRNVGRLLVEPTTTIHFALTPDGLWLDDTLLLHETLEFADLGRQVAARGIETISIDRGRTRLAVVGLVRFIAGTSNDVPDGEGVRLNDIECPPPIEPGSRGPGLRRAYQNAVETLRAAVFGVRTGEGLDVDRVKWVADRLVVASSGRPTATALLATMHNPTDFFFHHSVNTALLALEMGREAKLRVPDLRVLAVGALLHDIGKAIVVPEVVDDPSPLQPAQMERLRAYPGVSAIAILRAGVPGTEVAAVMAFEHTARHDGRGWPALPEGHPVHPAASLLAVVDVYDAVTSRRPYRRAETNGNALRILMDEAGSRFSPQMVQLFFDRFGVVPPGSCFRLRSGGVLLALGAEVEGVRGLIAEDPAGDLLATPEPALVHFDAIEGELSVLETAVRPAAYLDQVEALERQHGRPDGGGR